MEEKGKSRLSRRARVVLGFFAVFVLAIVIASRVSPTGASETPRVMQTDNLVLIAVDTDGDGKHDHEIAVSKVLNVATFDDGGIGIWVQGGIESLDPLSD